MPSAHSSTVTALTLALYFYEGFTNLFLVSLVFSLIVIRDTMLRPKDHRHEIPEVLAGMVIGLIIAWLVFTL